jgi:hypothetical protein
MAGFTSFADLRTGIASGNFSVTDFRKSLAADSGATDTISLWLNLQLPPAGANPATTPGTTYSGATTGAMTFPDVSPQRRFLSSIEAISPVGGMLTLYDRLVAVSGFVLNAVQTTTINSATLPRYSGTDAGANELWMADANGAITGLGGPIINVSSYTSDDGSTGLAGPSYGFVGRNANGIVIVPLDASHRGIRSVETMNCSDTCSTLSCPVMIVRPLARLMLRPNYYNKVDFLVDIPTMPRIFDGANLALTWSPLISNASSSVSGTISTVWG